MPHWTTRTFGQCAYLLTASDACCVSVVGGSAMGSRYCTSHYEAMIDRPAMARVKKARGAYTKHNALRKHSTVLTTEWDSGRA